MKLVFYILLLLLPALPARAEISHISEREFAELAQELAPKVNLFQDVWAKDPDAIFYGGTSRDYLYWLKGKFIGANSRDDALKIVAKLKEAPAIDVREFIIGESDVDVVSTQGLKVSAEQYGIRKIDTITPDLFNPSTEMGKNEIGQGHVPVEKIQISRKGVSQMPDLGNGLHEIYTGKLSVHFADPKAFAETKFAKEGINHPILLALRYLRLQGINYFKAHGGGLPKADLLFEGMDPASRAEVKAVIDKALDGNELDKYLDKNKFRSWLNGTIQKSFRSYTNPTAALEILKEFGVDRLSDIYGADKIEPINQYVFAQYRDQADIDGQLAKYSVKKELFYESVKKRFPDGTLYHGTSSEPAFRGILFQGVLPSKNGNGGAGLYGVALANRAFAEEWGEDKNRLVGFPVKPEARVVDITSGEGKRVYDAFPGGLDGKEEAFAKAFGVDILRYPYVETEAFVVKNSSALGHPQGVHRKLMSFNELLDYAKREKDAAALFSALQINQVSAREIGFIIEASVAPKPALKKELLKRVQLDAGTAFNEFGGTKIWADSIGELAPALIESGVYDPMFSAYDAIGDGRVKLSDDLLNRIERSFKEFIDLKQKSSREAYSAREKALLKAMANHRNWPNLPGTLKALEGAHDRHTAFLAGQIARSRLGPEKVAHLPAAFLQPALSSDGALRSYQLHAAVVALIEPKDPAMLPMLDEYLSSPAVVKGPQGGGNVEYFLAELKKKWPEQEEPAENMLRSYLLNAHGKSLSEIPGLHRKGFLKDPESLKAIHAVLGDKSQTVLTLLGNEMLNNGMWKAEPGVFASILRGSSDLLLAERVVKQPGLEKFPEMIEIITGNRHVINFMRRSLGEAFRRPEWADHPELLKRLLVGGHADMMDGMDVAWRALMEPAWAKHPELLEEFAFQSSKYPDIYSDLLQDLLDEPHWKNHPYFTSLYLESDQRIYAHAFMNHAKKSRPQPPSAISRILSSCAGLFKALKK